MRDQDSLIYVYWADPWVNALAQDCVASSRPVTSAMTVSAPLADVSDC